MLTDADLQDLVDATVGNDHTWRKLQQMHQLWHPAGRERAGLSSLEAKALAGAIRYRGIHPVRVTPQGDGLEVSAPVDTWEEFERRFECPEGFRLANVTRKAWQGQVSWRLGGGRVQLLGFSAHYVPDLSSQLQAPEPHEPFVPEQPEPGELRLAFVRPDTQHGFVAGRGGKLEPIHDRRALDAANQFEAWLNARFRLAHHFDLGDGLDLEQFSTFLQRPEARGLANAGIWSKAHDLEQQALASPSATHHYVGSNHDDRPRKRVMELLPELYGIRAYKDDQPSLSIEKFLRLTESGWGFTQDCPAQPGVRVLGGGQHGTEMWLFDDQLRVTHGDSAAKNAHDKHLSDAYSTVFGHVHRHVVAHKQVWTAGQLASRFAMSPGCLCRVDAGGPPPTQRRKNWQQGVALVWYDGLRLWHEWVEIHEGVLFWHGERFVGRYSEDDLEAWRAAR